MLRPEVGQFRASCANRRRVAIRLTAPFSAFIDAGVPSLYFLVGGNDPKVIADYRARGVPLPINHSPYFAPAPEPSIRRGVEVLTLAVLMVTTLPPSGK